MTAYQTTSLQHVNCQRCIEAADVARERARTERLQSATATIGRTQTTGEFHAATVVKVSR